MSAWVNLARYTCNKGQGLYLNWLITTLGLDSINRLKTSEYESDAHNVNLFSELIDNRQEFIIKAQKMFWTLLHGCAVDSLVYFVMVNAWFMWMCGVRIVIVMWLSPIEPCKQREN